MARHSVGLTVIAGLLVSAANAQNDAVVKRYCAGCHSESVKAGGFVLSKLDLLRPERTPELAEKVIRKLRAGMMPPAGSPRPEAAVLSGVEASLETSIDRAAALQPNPGRPALHRLNRTEYGNSVRDLLNLDVDIEALLPPDDLSHGFDNMADVLTSSPTLLEAYVRAAGKISRQAVGDAAMPANRATYSLPRVISQTRHVDGAPLGTRGGISVIHDFPADGQYIFRLTFYFHQMGTSLFGQANAAGQQVEVSIDGTRVALLDVNPRMKQTDELRSLPIAITAGPKRISAAFLQKFDGPLEDEVSPVEQSLVDVNVSNIPGLTSLPHLHDLIVDGPREVTGVSDTPSRRKIFVCRPATAADEIPCAKRILTSLARQAYRRPASPADLEKLLSFYQAGRNRGDFESGVQAAIQAILSNPEFIFRFERTRFDGTPQAPAVTTANQRITDLELASRLSYFLWSSAPDEELIGLASRGRLKEPLVLEKQVRRMLADGRSESLANNFARQWLNLQNLKGVLPDPLLYPNFDRNLADSMRRETELLFGNIVQQDRPVTELLTADYTFVDERLAKHYGIPNVLGNRFRRIAVVDDNRRGLLGHASILTLTSTANRTSPVVRGKWVMDVLLGTPPPSPPPNVPALKEGAETAKVESVRERTEAHRANPACAGCHKLMDPIGFALENFDATGAWREKDGGFPVDPAGELFDGTKVSGPASLRQALVKRSDAFVRAFTENLLAYGLGRIIGYADMPAVRAIDRVAASADNRFSAFVLGVVKSPAFQWRRVESGEPVRTELASR